MTRWQKALVVFFAAAVTFVTAVAATVQPEQITLDKLKALGQRLNLKIDPNQISASGISSGGFMAHQFHVAHSSNLMGVGIIAGGPYNCAQGSAAKGMQECTAMGEVIRLLDLPYLSYQGPDPAPQGREASDKAMAMAKQAVSDTLSVDKNNKIDNPKGLFGDRVILIHGKSDRLLPEGVMDATNQYYKMIYEHYGQALPADTLIYLKTLPAEHSVPTDNFIGLKVAAGEKVMVEKGERVGNCKTFGSPYLNVCAKQDCAGSCCPESAKPACGDPADSANPACTQCDLQCSTQCVTSIDASGMILKHIYGGPSQEWKPRSDNIKVKDWGQSGAPPTVEQGCKKGSKIDARCQWLRERIFAFDQPTVFADSRQSYLADKGFLFVPKQCAQGRTCKLHIAFHGCAQGYGFKDKDTVNALYSGIWPHFVENAGLNEWADANDIVVLYPQVLTTALGGNPFGCWNFWGYGADIINYPTKDGRQISAVWKMVEVLVPSLKQ